MLSKKNVTIETQTMTLILAKKGIITLPVIIVLIEWNLFVILNKV